MKSVEISNWSRKDEKVKKSNFERLQILKERMVKKLIGFGFAMGERSELIEKNDYPLGEVSIIKIYKHQ